MSKAKKLQPKEMEQIQALLREGVLEVPELKGRLEAMGIRAEGQQLAGLITLHKRRLAGDPLVPSPELGSEENPLVVESGTKIVTVRRPEPPQAAPETGDGFSWADRPGHMDPGKDGFSFAGATIEYHVTRIGPVNDGFLGVEPEGFNLEKLGQKYGSGMYEVVLYHNGKRIKSARHQVSQTFGAPKTPRASSAGPMPRLIHEDGRELPAGRSFGGGSVGASGDLAETVRAVREIKELTEEKTNGVTAKLVDRALSSLDRPQGQGSQDVVLQLIQAQNERYEKERVAERDRWENERKERIQRAEDERKDAEARHTRDIEKMREEFRLREDSEKRLAAERERRDTEQRDFMKSLEKDREKRLEEAINATNDSIMGLQAAQKEELEKERKHQEALAKLREDQLAIERERLREDTKIQREHNAQIFELMKNQIPGSGANKTEEMICNTIKDVVTRADAKVSETLEVRKLQELIKLVGPENAQQFAMSFLSKGGMDLGKIIAAKPGAPAEIAGQSVSNATTTQAKPAGGEPAGGGSAQESKGDGMNSIAQQVYETPFFKDLLEIWAGHLRKKRSPFLFANQLASYMLEDRRVELFYNYMAGKNWSELREEMRTRFRKEDAPFFDGEDAERHFDQVIDIVAKRIEADHVQRGIAPSSIEEAPEDAGKTA